MARRVLKEILSSVHKVPRGILLSAPKTATQTTDQSGDVVLEIASNVGFTLNVQTIAQNGLGQDYTITGIFLTSFTGVIQYRFQLSGLVPAGYYVRLRTVSNIGSPSFTYLAGQEVVLL